MKKKLTMKQVIKQVTNLLIAGTLAFSSMYVNAKTDSIAAIVNDSVILNSEVNKLLNNIKNNTRKQDLPDLKTLRRQVIEQLISETLILQEAKKAGIQVTDADLDRAINQIAAQNNMSLAQLKNYIKSIKIDFPDYREQIRKEMILEQTKLNALRSNINVSNYEIERVANNIKLQPANILAVNVSHILIALPENPSKQQLDEAQKKINDILDRLSKGESFAKLAASYSNAEDALQGGELGWNPIGALPSLFEQHLVKGRKGQVIGPLKSPVGFHLLKINDLKSDQVPSYNLTEVNAKHILIAVNILNTDEEAKAKIEKIRDAIETGTTTFEKAAKLYSDDPGSSGKGGELGWNNPDIFDPAFKSALLNLKKGEISKPVRSQFGWHLIALTDKRTVDSTAMAMKDQAYRMIFGRKFSEEAQAWTQALRGDAYIRIIEE